MLAQAFLPVLFPGRREPSPFLAHAAERPRYGGTLRLEMQASFAILDPTAEPKDSLAAAQDNLAALAYDRLVRLDEQLRPQAQLAVSWQHDADYRQWQFRLRPEVKFHDGASLTPSEAARALREVSAKKGGGFTSDTWSVRVFGETLIVETSRPRPDFLYELAHAHCSIVRRTADGVAVGTGPFRLQEWEPERWAVFVANDEHWAGRPYLDAIEVRMGRESRDQATALELGRADLVEVQAEQVRAARQRNVRVWSSAPAQLMALLFYGQGLGNKELSLREALALSLDRAALHRVLLQGQGEVADGLLPQWLSGYAFLFARARDLERARQLVGEGPPGTIVLAYDPLDPMAHTVAERCALNARDAGLSLRLVELDRNAGQHKADWVLARIHLLAGQGRVGLRGGPGSAGGERFPLAASAFRGDFFSEERDLLRNGLIVPLLYLPESFALSPRVRNWAPTRWGQWNLADVWLAPEGKFDERKEGGETR